MQFAVASVLLSTFVFVQATNADDVCGVYKQCDIPPEIARAASVRSLRSRVDQLEKDVYNFGVFVKSLFGNVDVSSALNRYIDYQQIADMKPVFWLSGSYYDGFRVALPSCRSGQAPQTDVLGNAVTRIGNVAINNDTGNLAYTFDKSNTIISSASVSTAFTFVAVFRFPNIPSGPEGRFFTSNSGNKLFAGWVGGTQELYIEGWINENAVKTTNKVILIMTNDNGVKNLWTHDKQLVVNSTIGANDWGQVVIGRPRVFEGEAAQVNVYEAMAFDKVLGADQRDYLLSVLKHWYNFN